MNRVTDIIPVRVAARPSVPPPPPVVRARWLFALWMAVGALIAVVGGLVLGLLAVLETGIGGDRWTPVVQAHGRLQLFGFVAVFMSALAMEFLPRLSGQPMFSARVRILAPAMLGLGAILSAAGQAFEPEAGLVAYPGGALSMAGAVTLLVVAARVPRPRPIRIDPQPAFIQAAVAWLVVSSALALWAIVDSEAGVIPLASSRAVVEVFLRGFVLLTVMGVGLRAFVGHLGLQPLPAKRQLAVLATVNGSLVIWLAGQGLGSLPELESAWRLGDVGHAASILLFTAWLGLLRNVKLAVPKGERYALLIPAAWVGVVVYAVALAAIAIVPGFNDLSLYGEGAVRHIFLLGFAAPLMLAMAHIVLARFGTGQVEWENALTLAFVIVLVAWPFRVIPALLTDTPGNAGQGMMGLAALLAMVGLALAAAVCLRTVRVMSRPPTGR